MKPSTFHRLKKPILLTCLIVSILSLGKALYWAKKGFSVRRVAFPSSRSFQIWDQNADLIVDQPFYYLGRGRQCFAFESSDGQYVLKLPRTDIYQKPLRMKVLPWNVNFNEKFYFQRLEREQFILESIKISMEFLQKDTGVVAMHFGTSVNKRKTLRIVDAMGVIHRLKAHNTTFVIQKKYPILMKQFEKAMNLKNFTSAKKILDALIDVIIARGSKGIWNKDESFLRNYGFDGEKAYQIDIGSFYFKENGYASILDTMHPIQTWLSKKDRAMSDYFNASLNEKLKIVDSLKSGR